MDSGPAPQEGASRNDGRKVCRQGTGSEVAYAALFLISNESSCINAHTLFIDGGHMAGIVRG
jgi:enoyl-[acyl-carrier-protein] reductase (NADH)